MLPTPLTSSVPHPPSLLDAIAAAARDANHDALVNLRHQLGYDSLDDKGRLAMFRALRRKVKQASDAEQDAAAACATLEQAFPVPYKALRRDGQRKGVETAFAMMGSMHANAVGNMHTSIMGNAYPPNFDAKIEQAAAALATFAVSPAFASMQALSSPAPGGTVLAGAGAGGPLASTQLPGSDVAALGGLVSANQVAQAVPLPDSWVRLRCEDGTLDAPSDVFNNAGYFDALINSKMQGGRDASGAYMVNTDIETLRSIVHWLSHDQLPHLTTAQQTALRAQADALCLPTLSAYIDQRFEDAALRNQLTTAQSTAAADIRKRLSNVNDRDKLAMTLRVFNLLMATLRNAAMSVPEGGVKINLRDTMLGGLARDIEHVLRGSHRTTYTYAFREGKEADEALHMAALACEDVLNQAGICITECSASAETDELTVRLLS